MECKGKKTGHRNGFLTKKKGGKKSLTLSKVRVEGSRTGRGNKKNHPTAGEKGGKKVWTNSLRTATRRKASVAKRLGAHREERSKGTNGEFDVSREKRKKRRGGNGASSRRRREKGAESYRLYIYPFQPSEKRELGLPFSRSLSLRLRGGGRKILRVAPAERRGGDRFHLLSYF